MVLVCFVYFGLSSAFQLISFILELWTSVGFFSDQILCKPELLSSKLALENWKINFGWKMPRYQYYWFEFVKVVIASTFVFCFQLFSCHSSVPFPMSQTHSFFILFSSISHPAIHQNITNWDAQIFCWHSTTSMLSFDIWA